MIWYDLSYNKFDEDLIQSDDNYQDIDDLDLDREMIEDMNKE